METPIFVGALVAAFFLIWLLTWFSEQVRDSGRYRELKPILDKAKALEVEVDRRDAQLIADRTSWERDRQRQIGEIERLSKEKSVGFPWLATAYAEYFALNDLKLAQTLETKKNPAPRAADEVRAIRLQRRQAEKDARLHRYIVEYYESLFPWLSELRDPNVDDFLVSQSEGEPTRSNDPAQQWLTAPEYEKLTSGEKFDLALRRYRDRKKTKWEIGRDFERFIGYGLEQQGSVVSYQGIIEGFADLGRDLIAINGRTVEVVQCKYWSRDKQIHEKHVFQLHSTRLAYEIDHPDVVVSAILVTSTVLSDRAKEFADKLGVAYREKVHLKDYPLVKCNIARNTGERIYHLPFDQQYDRTVIEPSRGEFYAASASEAESKGFRRAFRWHGEAG